MERSVWTSLAVRNAESRGLALTVSQVAPALRDSPIEYRDLSTSELVEQAIRRGEGMLADTGALVVATGVHTGRSPRDKFVVRHGQLAESVWWGNVNQPMDPEAFALLHADLVEHLSHADRYRMDLVAGADPRYQIPVRLLTESAWSALFARNLFLSPSTARADADG